ncbi:type III-B CRISPR-associated protein Cas10/Cmr2 [Sulfolobus islandicus]|uniref:CRISPR-associated protein, Cmr2 family n=1 Tax=Saccharolobus islandicus (strain HVE10/4) TaxID=930943 RepID=F0NNG1_SACI0|nr:type III-B CRISPR-associated protein Cas10/Cmr2 [Sulfolobus islandicus]ADX81919.1 CRISPR-associated protein, Cmr2 family [Sulfolobus islandicus HVE10/4]WCM36731.1 type III-B CRISPR-associated protein Cas10/Cmr2 [Sulfolobus islandicus]
MSEFLNKKIIAYFHDPPWKAWVITRNIREGHEKQAIELLKKLGIEKNEIPPEIKAADKLSSTIDRWIINILYSDNAKGYQAGVNKVMFKLNIFSPSKRFKLYRTQISEQEVENYENKLVNIINNEKEELKYHLIYFLSPLLWYDYFPNTPPLADTRVPTHTIFDHATATAAMLNIIDCEDDTLKFKGSIAVLEFPSIQEFISISRKSRDLWASSWLSSALLWKSIEEFIEKYGPDVALRPELSLNHFFIAWLYNKVQNSKSEVKKYAEKYAELKDDPRISMMSEKVILLLPEDDTNKIKDRLRKNFYNAWKSIAEEAIGEWEKLGEYIRKAIENPPVNPVINVVNVNDIFKEYAQKVGLKEVKCKEGTFPLEYSLFFEYLYRRAIEYNKVKYSYGSLISDVITKVTARPYKVCTVCGILPSILYYHSNDKIDDKENDAEDNLCLYCAIKRELKGVKLLNVLEKLGIKVSGIKYRFPSTSELAMADFAEHYVKTLKSLPEVEEEVLGGNIDAVFKNPTAAENYCKCYAGVKSACNISDEKLLKNYGNLYYAIIKADGDYMGKGFWSGILPGKKDHITIKEYMEEITNYLKEIGANNDLVQSIVNSSSKVEETLIDIRKKLYPNQKIYDQIPLTLAYAYTLSRSLTVQAVIDNKILRDNNAVAIYLGGDDILALSPIKFNEKYVVLDSVTQTRESYWRFADNSNNKFDGFKSYAGMVVDSLRAYGRSYSVFIAHYKDPLSIYISISNYLLELKDGVEGKDVIFISSGRGISNFDYSILKFSKSGEYDDSQIKMVGKILELMENKKKISNSFIYDAISISEYKGEKEVFKRLVYKVIDRNTSDEEVTKGLYNELNNMIGNYVCNGDACENKETFLSIIYAVSYLR